MKFKSILNHNSKIRELVSIVTSLSKHDERIIIITRAETMTFTVPRESKKPFYLWFDINGASFFSVYKMEGVNPSNPEDDIIYFEVNASYLLTALGSMKNSANFAEIKLGKEEFPFLTINMRIQSAADQEKNVIISNQVPVIIIPRIGWDDYELPYGTISYDVQAKCPRFPIFKRFIDIFKYSRSIRLVLRDDETLTLEANGDVTRHFTIFTKIPVTKYNPHGIYKGPAVSALIEHKKMSHWIHTLAFPTSIRLFCMIENNKHLSLAFRLRDDILGHFVIAAEYSDEVNSDDSSIGPSDQD